VAQLQGELLRQELLDVSAVNLLGSNLESEEEEEEKERKGEKGAVRQIEETNESYLEDGVKLANNLWVKGVERFLGNSQHALRGLLEIHLEQSLQVWAVGAQFVVQRGYLETVKSISSFAQLREEVPVFLGIIQTHGNLVSIFLPLRCGLGLRRNL